MFGKFSSSFGQIRNAKPQNERNNFRRNVLKQMTGPPKIRLAYNVVRS